MEPFLDWLYRNAFGRRVRPLLTGSRALHVAAGAFADSRASARLVPWLVRRYRIDLSDAVVPAGGFPTLNALFTRSLAPGARAIDPDPDALVSPADGRLLVAATVDGGTVLEVKGVAFDLATLVADQALGRSLAGGSAAIFRLYVPDCHRLVFPCAGVPSAPRLVPGGYGSVSPRPGNEVPFYVLNRRTVTTLDTERFGRLVVVDVGGFLVGTIQHLAARGVRVERGAPRSLFKFGGSTLVLLAGPGALRFDPALVAASARGEETPVRIGRAIAWSARR